MKTSSHHPFIFPIFCLLFYLGYLMGTFFPEPLWGVHFPAFLPSPQKVGVIGISMLFMIMGFIPRSFRFTLPDFGRSFLTLLPFGLAGIMGLLCWLFPIARDIYGDSMYIVPQTDVMIESWDPRLLTELLAFNILDPKIGTNTVYSLINMISYVGGIHGQQALFLLNVVCGMAFVFLWVKAVSDLVSSDPWRIILWVAGLTAPFLLMFFGHYEVYGPAYPCLLGFFITLQKYLEKKERKYLIGLVLLFILNLKFHITSLFLFPALLVLIADAVPAFSFINLDRISWKKALTHFLIPIHLAGMFVYFFITKSHFGGRSYTSETLEDVLFLPLKSHEPAPLDRYNLFSPEHMIDYLNLALTWSPIVLFLLGMVFVFYRKNNPFDHPALIAVGSILVIYISGFFALNPLLSLPKDWDLFSLPAPAWLFFALLVIRQIQSHKPPRIAIATVLAVSFLSSLAFFIHSQPETLSKRYTSLGTWKFKTYWIGASTPLHIGAELSNDPQEERLRVLEELEPFAIPENDVEYADLLCEAGIHFADEEQDFAQALPYFQQAYRYSPPLTRNLYRLVVTHFMMGQFPEAHQYTRKLIQVGYPSKKKAFRIGIHTSLEASAYEDATTYCKEYLDSWPADTTIRKIYQDLENGENLDQLKFHFRRK